jgi:hypothetical protein
MNGFELPKKGYRVRVIELSTGHNQEGRVILPQGTVIQLQGDARFEAWRDWVSLPLRIVDSDELIWTIQLRVEIVDRGPWEGGM